jgi:signal transduction histidine kinase
MALGMNMAVDAAPVLTEALVPLARIESILCTEELYRRPSRRPEFETEHRALLLLVQALADSPRSILQRLADSILQVVSVDSAGISLLTKEDGGKHFYWPAIAGMWKPYIGGGTPREFGPCGDVLDRNTPLLFRHFERRYTYFLPVIPPVEECLLVPFHVDGHAVGTVWAIAHDAQRTFDREDLRRLESLARFASAAYQATLHLADTDRREKALQRINADLQHAQHALREADRRKDIFIATVAHELRQPIGAMLAAIALMRERVSEQSGRRARDVVERQVTHLGRIVGDLLDIARIVEGKIELQKQRLDCREVIQEALDSTTPLCEEHHHTLSVDLPDEPMWVEADRTRLLQVFANLLTNAAKYTQDGGEIWLNAETDRTTAVVRIQDNGKGIAPGVLPRIFDLFIQEDNAPAGGLGIGLRVVRELVELHGGSVAARSDGIGRGSEFIVRLPIVPPSATSADAYPSKAVQHERHNDLADRPCAHHDRVRGQAHDVHDGSRALQELQRDRSR